MTDRTITLGVLLGVILLGCLLVLLFAYLHHRHEEHAEEIESLHGKADELVKNTAEAHEHASNYTKESRYTTHRMMTRLQWLLAMFHPQQKRKDDPK